MCSPFRAERATVIVFPPQASGFSPCLARSDITLFRSAPGLSVLLMATIIGIPAALMWSIASTVWAMTPSSAATTRIAMSVALAPRARIPVNALCPGVSMNVILCPCRSAWYAPIPCVIPPASLAARWEWRIASRRVVFPWSMCPRTDTTGGRGTPVFGFAGLGGAATAAFPAALGSAAAGAFSSWYRFRMSWYSSSSTAFDAFRSGIPMSASLATRSLLGIPNSFAIS